jgi:transcription-repair coupling factor (superfamily II helicase)
MSPSASRTDSSHPGPSLAGLRRALAEDRTFARVKAEAERGFDVRGQDYQISAPA